MLEFTRIPFNEFQTMEDFRIRKNSFHDIVISTQIHIPSGRELKDIRIYSKRYNTFTRKGIRITKVKWFEFLKYVYEINEKYPLEEMEEEDFIEIREKYLFKKGKETIMAKTEIYRGYRGIVIGEFINGEPSNPNLVWFPLNTLDELIEKSGFNEKIKVGENDKVSIDEKIIQEILQTLDELRKFVEMVLRDTYGEKWWDKGVSKHEGKAREYYESDMRKMPGGKIDKAGHKKIYYLDIKELAEIITDPNNWKMIFSTYFDGKTKDDRLKVLGYFNNFNVLRQHALHRKPIDSCLFLAGISGMKAIQRFLKRVKEF